MEKKILIVTRNLPPLIGGMERLNWHIVDELAKKNQVKVICPKGSHLDDIPNITYKEIPLKPLPIFLITSLFHAIKISLEFKPNIILAGSGLTSPIAWLTARLMGAISATYVHGLDIVVNHIVYQSIWLPFIRAQDIVIANSSVTASLAKEKRIKSEKINIIHPGVCIDQKDASHTLTLEFCKKHELGAGPFLLFIGRITKRKGLKPFLLKIFPEILKCYPTTQLIVVGEPPTHALNAAIDSQDSILDAISQLGLTSQVKFIGSLDIHSEQLAVVYQLASVHIFPIQAIPGDIEGFGMVAIEAAAHGTQTVAFAVGGVVDAIAEDVSGRLIEVGNNSAFASAVIDLIKNPLPKNNIKTFSQQFSWQIFAEKLILSLDKKYNLSTNRQPHAILDLASRRLKGIKIEKLLALTDKKIKYRLLEIGTGSGGIAHYFACQSELQCEVTAIDTVDQRLIQEGYQFVLVGDTHLPFANESFDIVISNHCIEHVGECDAQMNHLHEIKRVLKKEGIGYLAVPNRWMLVEPHYQLIFLSWLPKKWRSSYLRYTRKGKIYDCEPLAMSELETLLYQTGFHFKNKSLDAIDVMHKIEPNNLLASIISKFPLCFLEFLRPIIPTLIYTCSKK